MGEYVISGTQLPVCIVVHLEFLAKQWLDEILKFTTIDKVVIHDNMKLQASMSADVVIAKVQSLIRMPYENNQAFFDRFNLAIFDEVHTMGSMEFNKAISLFPCKRMGLTATPQRTDGFRSFKWSVGVREVQAVGDERIVPRIFGFDTGLGDIVDTASCCIRTRMGTKVHVPKLINHLTCTDKKDKDGKKPVSTSHCMSPRNDAIISIS